MISDEREDREEKREKGKEEKEEEESEERGEDSYHRRVYEVQKYPWICLTN